MSTEVMSSHLWKFELPSGNASATLKEFARQAMVDIVFDPSVVDGVVTNGVSGVLPPRKALDQMLKGTGLVIHEDQQTGAFAVVKSKDSLAANLNNNTEPSGNTMNENKNSSEVSDSKARRGFISLMAAIVSAVTVNTTYAQEETDTTEEVFELSPFEVDASDDVGYVATSTLTGSRLRTKLSDVASSVSVYTEEFLNDTGMSDIQDLSLYSVSTRNDSQDTSASGDDNSFQSGSRVVRRVRLRGILGTKGLDYFQSFVPDDSYRVARYDESRGPNGILFGISDPGGIINTTTRRANTRVDRGRVRYSWDEHGRNRAEGYYNKVLIDGVLGVTLAGLYQDSEDWRRYVIDDRERIYGALMWNPTKKLSISFNGETGDHSQTRYRRYAAADGFQAWVDHGRQVFELTGNNPSSDERAAGVVSSYGSGNRVIYVSNDDTGSPYYFQGGRTYYTASYEDRRVDGTYVRPEDGDVVERMARIIGSDDFPYPRELNAVGPGSVRDTDFDTYTINLDYRITKNLNFNIAHNMQDVVVDNTFTSGDDPILRGDPNATILNPDQDPNNENMANPYAGRLFFEGYWRRDDHRIDYEETRAALSYDFDLTNSDNSLVRGLGRHRLALGYSYREVSDMLVGQRLGFLGAPFDEGDFDDSRNRLIVRHYIEEGNFSTYVMPSPPPLGPVNIIGAGQQELGWVHNDRGTNNARSDVEVDSYILALQSYFWNDRLTTIVGWRRDEADNVAFGTFEDPLYGDTLTTDPEARGYRDDDPVEADTKTIGAVFDVTENFSLVANYATSIGLPEFRNVTLPNSAIPEPVDGKGYDIGVAFNLNDGRISGRLVYYDVEQIGLTTSGGITRIVRNPMQESMEALDDLYQSDPSAILKPDGSQYSASEWGALVEELGPEVNAVYQDVHADGWELTVTANLTDNWRFNFNASYTDRELSNYGREFLKLAGYQLDKNGLAVQAVTLSDPEDQMTATVDYSLLSEDGLHRRIMEVADGVVGQDATTFLTDEDSAAGGSFDVNDATVAYQMYDSINVLNYEKSIREGRLGLNPWKFNVWTTYDFTEGALEGFSLGGGVRYLGPKVMGRNENGAEIKSPSETDFDLMLRYRQELRNDTHIDYQVNVYNVFDKGGYTPERHVILARTDTPLSRYRYRDPRTIRVTVTYSF